MITLLSFLLALFTSPFKLKSRLEAENAVLRHQLAMLRRKVRGRVQLTSGDRFFLIQLYRWFPSVLKAVTIIQPATLVRWHRAGFRRYWRWKSRCLGGRPQIDADLRALIQRMSADNPLWGAPRIHGELLKLGFEVAQSSVAKYMTKRAGPPAQGWSTFLRNHAPNIASMDLFVVPTIGFELLYAFVIVRLDRRNLVWVGVTTNPTAEWIVRQLTEAFPWEEAPRYLIRDRDRAYGAAVVRRVRAMGIRDKPIAPASPWQNGFAERLIGSIRRECVDHFIVLGEAHLRRILQTYARYYNVIRTHWSLEKMRRFRGQCSGSDQSNPTRSLADSITIICGFRFSVHTGSWRVSPSRFGGSIRTFPRWRIPVANGKQGLDTTTPAGRRDMTQNSLLDHMDQVASLQFSRSITVINPQPIDEAIVVPLDRHDDAPYRHEVAGPHNSRCTYQRCGSADETIATSDHRWLATLTECHSASIPAGSRATQRRPEASLRLHSATWPTSSRCKD